jgi:hypothetical protein
VPLSLGGAPEDLRNVWPEPKAEAKEKDEVEDPRVLNCDECSPALRGYLRFPVDANDDRRGDRKIIRRDAGGMGPLIDLLVKRSGLI